MTDLPFSPEAVVHWLLWQSIYVTGLAAAMFAPIKLAKIRDPRWLVALWSLVLVRFLLPVSFAAPWGIGTLWQKINPLEPAAIPPPQPVTGQSGSVGPLPITQSSFDGSAIIILFWLLGVAIMVGLTIRQLRNLHVMLKQASAVPPETQAKVDHLRAQFGIKRGVTLRAGDATQLPFTTGLFAPVIYISRSQLDSLSPDDLDAVLAHELAHIRSFDILWLWAERVVQALFFFHPVAWIATHQLAQAREHSCDIQAVKHARMQARQYWSAVLNLVHGHQTRSSKLAMASTLGRSAQTLKARMDSVQRHSNADANPTLVITGLTALLGATALPVASMPQRPEASLIEDVAAPAPASAPETARQKALANARARVVEAEQILERYRRGDFGDRTLPQSDGSIRCAPNSWPEGVQCAGVFSQSDIRQLVWEAEDNLAKAVRSLADIS